MKRIVCLILCSLLLIGIMPVSVFAKDGEGVLQINVLAEEGEKGDVTVNLTNPEDVYDVISFTVSSLDGYQLSTPCKAGIYSLSYTLSTGDGVYYYAYCDDDTVEVYEGEVTPLNMMAGSAGFIQAYKHMLFDTDGAGNAASGEKTFEELYEMEGREFVPAEELIEANSEALKPNDATAVSESANASASSAFFPASDGKDESYKEIDMEAFEKKAEEKEKEAMQRKTRLWLGVLIFGVLFVLLFVVYRKNRFLKEDE